MYYETGAAGRAVGDGVELGFEWWPGSGPLVGIHGLTSHRRAFAALADAVSPGIGVLAFDLRGRGEADKPSSGSGILQHARDVAEALEDLAVRRPVVLVGHSMGAFVAEAFAAEYPERTAAVVLVDGGFSAWTAPSDDAEAADAVFEEVLSPFLDRLRRTWDSVDQICEHFGSTPLYAGMIDDAARRYFAFDVSGPEGQLRAKASEDLVAEDWRDLLTNPKLKENLGAIKVPCLLLRAPGGLTGVGDAVIPDAVRDEIAARVANLEVVDLPGLNHHTILTTRPGAQQTAAAIMAFLQRHGLSDGAE